MRKNKSIRGSFFKNFKLKYFTYAESKEKLNIYLFLFVIILGLIGLAFLLSASSYLTIKYNISRYYYVIRQGIFFILTILAMILFSKLNYNFYKKYSKFIYLLGIILLILVYIPPFKSPINGARRAINLGIVFMPADFAKLSSLIFLADFLSKNQKKMEDFYKGLIPTIIIMGIPFILIFLQTDLSTSMVLLLGMGCVYLIGGFKKNLIPITLILIISFGIFAYYNLEQYQLNRLTAHINPELHYDDLSWQVLNGLFAVSRGGVLGQGFGKSIYKHGYLADEVHNDMIFAVISEEVGFVGSVLIILLIFLITYLIIKEALKSKNLFAKFLCFGIGMIYFIQSMINIGVSIGVVPNTGITLPFISNGGTSMFAFGIMFGVVLNISRFNRYDNRLLKKQIKLK